MTRIAFVCFQSLCLRRNKITKIEGLSTLTTLEELDLYDNQITQIEGLDNNTNLTWDKTLYLTKMATENIMFQAGQRG